MNKKKSYLPELTVSIITILFSIFAAETALRILFVLPHPLANYYPLEIAKLGKTIHIDQYEFSIDYKYGNHGFRDRSFAIEKPTNKKRILFIGDSFTEGFGVNEEDRFSNQVATALGDNYEVINVGQLATNPDVYFDNLLKFGIALKPDLIVMGVFLGNDFQGGRGLPPPDPTKLSTDVTTPPSFASSFSSLSYLRALAQQVRSGKKTLVKNVNFVGKNYWDLYFNEKIDKDHFSRMFKISNEKLDEITKGFNPKIVEAVLSGRLHPGMFGEAVNNQLHIEEPNPYYLDSDYATTYEYLKASNKLAEENGAKFLVLIIPNVNQVHPDEYKKVFENDFLITKVPERFRQVDEFHSRLSADLSQDKIQLIDSTEQLRKSTELTYYLYDNHMNRVGHRLIGDLLVPTVSALLK